MKTDATTIFRHDEENDAQLNAWEAECMAVVDRHYVMKKWEISHRYDLRILEALVWLQYEGLGSKDTLEQTRFQRGALVMVGRVLKRHFGCVWIIQDDGTRRDYALCHPAFPTPLILNRIHDYLHDDRAEVLHEDARDIANFSPSTNAYDVLLETLRRRIKFYESGKVPKRPIEIWRTHWDFSLPFRFEPPQGR